MNGFLYSLALQWKLDIRSKSLLVTYYIVPLIFFLLMGGIFTSVIPDMESTHTVNDCHECFHGGLSRLTAFLD